MASSRSTMLRRIGGLAAAGAAGLLTVVVVYGMALDPESPPGSAGTTRRPPPTVGTTNPGVTGTPDPGDAPTIDSLIAGLRLANVAFNAPTTMRLDRPMVIQLLLSGKQPIRELKQKLTALGEQEGAQIRASDAMEADLAGAGFDIVPVTPTVQLVSRDEMTEWQWEVTPTEAGDRRLHLTLSALIDLGSSEKPYTVRTFQRTLVVNVPLRVRLETFVDENWQWLWTALVVPVGLFLLQRHRRGKVPPSGSTPPDAAARPSPQ
jgi:hypothetical protein